MVTGGAVRLTASGLGCPTWPRCTDGSLATTPEMGIHGIIEFGNRLLTFALAAVAVMMLVYLWNLRKERRDLFLLALGLLASIPAQAVIGGITVLTQLNPWVVGLHFLVSMALVVLATLLVNRAYGRTGQGPDRAASRPAGRCAPGDGRRRALLRRRRLPRRGGDRRRPACRRRERPAQRPRLGPVRAHPRRARLPGDRRRAVRVVLVVRGRIPGPFRSAVFMLLGVTVLQAVIGFTQYYNGIPALLVGAHMLAAALLMSAATNAADLARYSPGEVAPPLASRRRSATVPRTGALPR